MFLDLYRRPSFSKQPKAISFSSERASYLSGMRRPIYHPIISIILSSFLVTIIKGHEACPYGHPCFLPALPGKTPSCALPGLTYCEQPKHYPRERIQHLIQQWRFDHQTILIDESKDEFQSYQYPLPHFKYGPPNTIKPDNGYSYPEPIHIPKPLYTFNENTQFGNSYIPPKFDSGPYNYSTFQLLPSLGNRNEGGKFLNYKYTTNIPPGPFFSGHIGGRRRKRAILMKKSLLELAQNGTKLTRKKRQTTGGDTLCPTRSQFIMPRAALNNQGNWMYVVNMPEMSTRYTQLVRSETCASQTCNALCGLPLGYSSRCEQKYIQKRLVALEGSGSELYNDLFWIPSCCVCTISNN